MNPPPLSSPPAKSSSRGCLLYSGIVIITFLLVFMTSAVITYVMPKKFESTAVVQVRPSAQLGQNFTPQFFATEFEVIRAHQTLKLVTQRLGLTTQWNMTEEDAIAVLKGIVDAQNLRGTDLILIKVRHTSPEQARDIAKEVYEAYKKRREEKAREILADSLKEMEKAIVEQSQVIQTKQEKMREMLMDAGHSAEDISKRIEQEFARDAKLFDQSREQLAMDRLNSKLVSLVELHEEPLVAQYPSSPNVTLNLILGATLGLLFGLLMALFVRLVFGRRISG